MKDVIYSIYELIEMVKNRPILWDSTSRNSKEKKLAWKEICAEMDSRYSGANSTTKELIKKKIKNKWRNVKDIFTKTIKLRQRNPKIKKYMYHDQLSFLLKDATPTNQKIQRNHVSTTTPVLEPESSAEISEPPSPLMLQGSTCTMAKMEMDDEEKYLTSQNEENLIHIDSSSDEEEEEGETILKIETEPSQQHTHFYHENPESTFYQQSDTLHQQSDTLHQQSDSLHQQSDTLHKQSNEDEAFFASILSSIRNLTEAEKLEFRITVLQTIGNIKSKRGASLVLN